MPHTLPKLLCLLTLLALSGCTGVAFMAANLPATFGPYQRTAGIAYGPADRHRLDIYVPDAAPEGPRPVVVFFHGGGWTTGSRTRYRFVGSALAGKGLITVVADYRLHPDGAFPLFVEDAALAVAWVGNEIARHGGDPGQLFLLGHSAGAHIAALLALDRRYLRAVGSSPGALRGVIGLSGPYDFELDSARLREVFGAVPDVRDTQPVAFARGDAPPLLLLHGSEDRICAPWQSGSLAERVRAAGGRATVRIYPGVDHVDTVGALAGYRRSRAPTLDDIAAFVAGH